MSDQNNSAKPEDVSSEEDKTAHEAIMASTAQSVRESVLYGARDILLKIPPHFALTALRGVATGLALALGEVEAHIAAGYVGHEPSDGKSVEDHLTEDRVANLATGRADGAACSAQVVEFMEKLRAALESGDMSALKAAGATVLGDNGVSMTEFPSEDNPDEELPTEGLFGANRERFES